MRTKPISHSAQLVAEHLRATVHTDDTTVDDHEIGAKIGIEADTVYRSLRQLETAGALQFTRHRPGPGSIHDNHGRTVIVDWAAPIWAYIDAVARCTPSTTEAAR